MSLTKEVYNDKIEIVGEYNAVQVREVIVVSDGGAELSRSYSRKVIEAGEDYSAETPKVQSICSVVHTSEVIDAFEKYNAEPNG